MTLERYKEAIHKAKKQCYVIEKIAEKIRRMSFPLFESNAFYKVRPHQFNYIKVSCIHDKKSLDWLLSYILPDRPTY